MPRPLTSAQEVERLLKQAGVAVPARGGRPPRRPKRRFRRLLLLLVLCAVLAAAITYWVFPAPVGDHAPVSGPSKPAALGGDPRFGAVEAFAAPRDAATLGVRWERIPFWWKELQKKGPDSWDPFATGHDAAINAELAAGRSVVGLLINTPDWAAAIPAAHGASPPRGLYLPYNDPGNYWGHFVSLIAKRYAGRIDDWIIWNEVNIPSGKWHTWAGSAADYAQLVKVAYLAAKAANPHARIVLAGDPYWYDHGAFFTGLLRRLTAGHQHGGYFDVANLHLYSRPSDIATIVGWYRRSLARFGLRKPIWISETNAIPYNDSARPLHRGNFYASLDDQASYMVQAYAIALAMGVERIEVNRMVDGAAATAGGEPFGLVRNDGTLRPAFSAYHTVVDLFSGVTGGNAHLTSAGGIARVDLRRPGAAITVIWDQRPAAAAASIAALGPTAVLYDKFGTPRVIHARRGVFTLSLAAATGNTNSANPQDYVVGGSPLIVVQRP